MATKENDPFMDGGSVEIDSGSDFRTEFTVKKVEKKMFEAFGREQMCYVFELEYETENGVETVELGQASNNANGNPASMLRPMTRNKNDGRVYQGTLAYDILKGAEEFLGVDKISELKKKHGGYNINFFTGLKFMSEYQSGISKKTGKPYFILHVGDRALLRDWDYMLYKGIFEKYEEIPKFREYFNLEDLDNTEQVESIFDKAEEEDDGLPFG